MKRAIIFINGNLSDLNQAKKNITYKDCLIAADGGVKHILELGLIPNVIIGDFDSTPKNMRSAPTLIKYPIKKDKTDFELTIDYCLKNKFNEIIIFGFLGDRIDHFFANIMLLARIQTENKSLKIKIIEGKKEIFVLTKELTINGQTGDEVSIVPVRDNLKGVTTDGLYYRLIDDTLSFGSTRGVSNVMKKNVAKITITEGIALITHLRK